MADPSRRDVLRLAGAGAGALWLAGGAGAIAAGCGDNLATKPPGESAGAILFEPTSSSFLVSAWSRLARAVALDVRTADGTAVTRVEVQLFADQAVARIDGLTPSTTYTVTAITDDGALLGPHTIRTAPALDDPRPIRIAVSADLDPQPEFDSDLFAQIIAAAPEVFVTIGDVPYTDNGPPATTVATYRERHGLLRTKPNVRAWLQAMGLISIYDDHEFRNDWDAARAAAEPERYAAAIQVWDEFFPIAETPDPSGVRYRSFRWGANVEGFVLDCRRFRSPNDAPDHAQKTMLGAAQKAWFLAAIARSTATFKLVFTSVPLDYGNGVDHWAGFTSEREELFAALHQLGITGLLFLSGDQHYFAAYTHSFGIREFQVGPLARGLGEVGPDGPGVLFRDVRYNFGLIDIAGDTLTMSGVGPGGDVFYKETFSSAQLTPG